MNHHRTFRTLVTASVCLTLAAPAAPAFATPAASRVVDGKPTPEACAAYGFGPRDAEKNRGGRQPGWSGSTSYRMPPPPALMAPPPPPPSLPPPSPLVAASPSSKSVQEVVVTSSRIQRREYAGAPVITGAPSPQTDTARYPHATPNPVKRVAEVPVSTFSIDVDTASYANVRRSLRDGELPSRDAVRVEEMINYFDYAYPHPTSRETPFQPFVAVAPSPWSAKKQILHVALQGYDLPRRDLPALNLVFLVDVSGSMSPEDRLPLAKKALNVLIDQLRPQDTVALAVYAGAAGTVLEPTPGTQKLKMRCALQALDAGGSTAGGAGLKLAYRLAEKNFRKGAVNRVVMMTDGDFNVGMSGPDQLKTFVAGKRQTGVYLSVYGFGGDNYNDEGMQALAQTGNGTAGFIDSLGEAKKTFRHDFTSALFPIADDVKIQVEFNPARVSEYRLIGYETRLLNREDFNNDKVDAGEVGSGAAVTALYEITPAGAPGSVDPLRYQSEAAAPSHAGSGELAFVKVRYKLPGQPNSHLIERAVTDRDATSDLARAPASTRWALAVAAYGQRLRGDPWIEDGFGWTQIAELARHAGDDDAFGSRAEFLGLVDAAARASPPAQAQR